MIVSEYGSLFLRATAYIMLWRVYAIARPFVRPSVIRVDHTKTVEVRIMKFSPYGSPIPLVSREQVSSQMRVGYVKLAIFEL